MVFWVSIHPRLLARPQEMGREVSRWMYVMIGRLIYEVGELDGWQVLPFLKGAASSGKSTILTRVCRNLYDQADVGTLSNNIERKFGLSALADKLLFIGPEIKADIQLEQAEFQSIVSGETVQVGGEPPRTPLPGTLWDPGGLGDWGTPGDPGDCGTLRDPCGTLGTVGPCGRLGTPGDPWGPLRDPGDPADPWGPLGTPAGPRGPRGPLGTPRTMGDFGQAFARGLHRGAGP